MSGLVNNIVDMLSYSNIMTGGKNMKNGIIEDKQKNILITLIVLLFVLLINGLIIFLVYNMLVPKIIYSLSDNTKSLDEIEANFKPLTYMESVLLVIFTKTLFSSM
jgi:cytochrome b subunit of formate dehydrogenase